MKKEWKKGLSEALEVLLGGRKRLWAHQNWAWEPKAGSKTALKTTSLFDYWQLCNGNGLWNQWTCVIQREKLNLSGSSCLFSPFCLSLSFSSSASASALWWTFFQTSGQDGQRCLLHFSRFMLLTRFISSCLSLVDKSKLSSRMAAHPSLCWVHYLEKERNEQQREGTGSQSCRS